MGLQLLKGSMTHVLTTWRGADEGAGGAKGSFLRSEISKFSITPELLVRINI
jgi:hypothetical protein